MSKNTSMSPWLHRLFPFLKWLPKTTKSSFKADLIAGLTGAIIVLPQGVAFAVIAGMPPEYGLYTAMIPAIVGALFGSSNHLVSGPTTTGSIMLFTFLTKFADPGSGDYVQLALTLTFYVGIMKIIFGVAKLGNLVNFISNSVIIGYTSGAAILIAFKQLKNFTGVPVPRGLAFYEILGYFFQHLTQINFYILLTSMLTLISGVVVKKYFPKIPYMIFSMIFGSVVAYFINLYYGQAITGIETVGALPASLPPLSTPQFDLETFKLLMPAVLAATILTLTEAVSIARALSVRSGQTLDINQEFIGQGISNITGAFTSGYMSTGSFNRSGANYEAGAQTPISGVFAGLFLIGILILVAPFAAYLPKAAMAGILFMVAYGIFDFKNMKYTLKTSKGDTAVMVITFLSTLFLDLEFAILVGAISSLTYYLSMTSHPAIFLRVPDQGDTRRKFTSEPAYPACPQVKFIRIDGSFYFGAIGYIKETISQIMLENPEVKHIVIFGQAINLVDSAGASYISQLTEEVRSQGKEIYFYKLKPKVKETLKKAGTYDLVGENNFFRSKGEIIEAIIPKFQADVCKTCHNRIFKECEALPKPN